MMHGFDNSVIKPARECLARGMTLLETMLSILVIAIIAAVIMPVMAGASEGYINSVTVRRAAEQSAYAMERCTRLLRDVPPGTDVGTVGIVTAEASRIVMGDGRGFDVVSGVLYMTDAAGVRAPLCESVESLVITYLESDGVTDCMAAPERTQRFSLYLRARGFELRSAAAARARMLNP